MPPIDDLMTLDNPSSMGTMPIERDTLTLDEPDQFGAPDEQEPSLHEKLIRNIQNPNIAADLEDDQLSAIGQKVLREYELDLSSRSEWEEKSQKAMELAMQVAKEKTFPWNKASNVIYPAMTVAAMQFNARAYPAIVQGRNVCKGVVVGDDNGIPIPPQLLQQLQMMMGGGAMGGMLGGPMPGLGAPGMDPSMPMQQPPGPQGAQQQGQQPQMWLVPPGAKADRAKRIGEHMSWQLLEQMTEWEEQTDKKMLILPIVGCSFRKSFFDHALNHNSSLLVLAQNLVIDHHAESMERAPRITERINFYPYEIQEQVRKGLWLDHNYGIAQNANGDEDAPHEFLEQHRWLDLDDDDYPEPYIVTVHKQTGKVARIVARYDAEGVHIDRSGQVTQIEPTHYYTKYDFIPNPDGGIYGVGFGQLLGPLNEATNTAFNQIFDAGTLQTAGGGFIGRGVSMHAGSLKFKLGEWKQVNTPGSALKDAIVPFNHPGPSAVMFQVLGLLIQANKEVSSIQDILTGETAAQTMQPTTLMALIEQGTKVFSAIYKRVHRSLHKELNKLYRLNRIYMESQQQYQAGDEWRTITQEDYARGAGVTPVSDPNMVMDMRRMAEAQFLQSYQNDPLVDQIKIRKRVFEIVQVEKGDEFIVQQPPPNPAILAQTADLELKHRDADTRAESAKASQVRDITQALLNIANAEKAMAGIDQADASIKLEHSAQFIEYMELQLKALLAPADGRGQQDGQAPQPPAMPQFSPAPALPSFPSSTMLQ